MDKGTKYKVWLPTKPGEDFEDRFEIETFEDDEFITLERVRELMNKHQESKCRIAQGLPGTEYTMWCDEESKMRENWKEKGNPGATQEWQDSAAHHMGWDWLSMNYGGFIWNHDFAVGPVVQILHGHWEEDEGVIRDGICFKE